MRAALSDYREKRALLDARKRAKEARVNVALSFAEAVKHLDAALIAEEENAAARAALAALWEERLGDAERRRDEADVAYAVEMIRRYHGEPKNEGTLQIVSDPPGAQVLLYR